MTSYENSKYYELQTELINAGLMETDEGLEQDLKNYEDELNWTDNGGDWLASHFNSTAEYLAENEADCFTDEEFDSMVDRARKEIEITRKANGGRYENFARMYEEWLTEAIFIKERGRSVGLQRRPGPPALCEVLRGDQTDSAGDVRDDLPEKRPVDVQQADVGGESMSNTGYFSYYTPYRPPMPGGIPKGAVDVWQFDSLTYVREIDRHAWGRVTYDRMLTARELIDYELMEDPANPEMVTDRTVYIVSMKEREDDDMDIWSTPFTSREKADAFVEKVVNRLKKYGVEDQWQISIDSGVQDEEDYLDWIDARYEEYGEEDK